MENKDLYKKTGIVLLICIFLSMVGMILLEQVFKWDGSSLQSIGETLSLYHSGGKPVRILWTIFGMGAFLLGPLSLLLHKIFKNKDSPYLYIGTTLGVISSVAYIIGLMRWILLAGVLAPIYSDPTTTVSMKETLEVIFYSFNVYAGNGFGETLAPITHGIWLIFLGRAMRKSAIVHPFIALLQIIGGCVILIRPLEYIGWDFIAPLSDLGLQIWAILFIIVGIRLLTINKQKTK